MNDAVDAVVSSTAAADEIEQPVGSPRLDSP